MIEFDDDPGELDDIPDDVLMKILRLCGLGNRRLKALRALMGDWLEG